MKYSEITHIGLVRQGNEDSYCVCPDLNLVAVADGMGGHEAGEVASRMALQAIEDFLRKHPEAALTPKKVLHQAVLEANSKVFEAAQKNKGYRGMGTTLSAGLLLGRDLYLAHIGDSRVYLINNQVNQLTQDHSLVNELVLNGGISEEEALNHPQKNILTRALGTIAEVNADLIHTNLKKGERLLFCTDGLSNLIVKEEIFQVVSEAPDLSQGVQRLLAMALERGGKDNITMILVEIE